VEVFKIFAPIQPLAGKDEQVCGLIRQKE